MIHLADVIRAIKATTLPPTNTQLSTLNSQLLTAISTDSRAIKNGELFFAIKGTNFDGHNFVADSFKNGAVAAVISDETLKCDGLLLLVKDTLTALGDLSAFYRKQLKAKVITVTGSNGKTTTKDMIAHILSKEQGAKGKGQTVDGSVVKAQGSFNNFIGLPLTLFRADERAEFIVLEVGTNKPGEISRLGEIARPDVAVITNVSEAHLEGFGSVENIAKEKRSILGYLSDKGIAVLNLDNPYTADMAKDVRAKRITFGFDKSASVRAINFARKGGYPAFVVTYNPVDGSGVCEANCKLPNLSGWWNVYNALAATAACVALGIDIDKSADALLDFRPPKMRMERVELGGIIFINDAYNSNPVSARNAVEEFAGMECQGRKVAVIGDMRELGKESQRFHRELGEYISRQKGIEVVICVGENSRYMLDAIGSKKEKYHFASVSDASKDIAKIIKQGDMVLLKGSRAIWLEKILDYFKR